MNLLYFLYKNGRWLRVSNETLYKFAKGVAKSKPASREKIILHINSVINKYLTSLK